MRNGYQIASNRVNGYLPPLAMNTPHMSTNVEPRWLAYARAGAFLVPALLAWWFSVTFLFPKLQQIWTEAGFHERAFFNILRTSNFLMANSVWLLTILVLMFGFLEWRGGAWFRYRRLSLGIGVWLFNAAVLLLLTAMLLSALMAAPGLIPRL